MAENKLQKVKTHRMGSYDVAVIGGGHAGLEAAVAAARLGARTVLFTLSLDAIANLPCNPSIGGTAKGHLVREIDALGGCMGLLADATTLQSRMLNRGKGPAVHSLRVQTDRRRYNALAKQLLEHTPNLHVKQAEIIDVLTENGHITGVVTKLFAEYHAKAVVVATGTCLGGKVHVGDASYASGPDGTLAANELGAALRRLGLPMRRFKTGTPARVHRRSIDFSGLKEQPGDACPVPFSFQTQTPPENRVLCHLSYTNERTHAIIRENLHRSPLYSGKIEGIGPRYCPSIEDKVVRFPEKTRHQLFIEPCGLDTDEMYLQGMSSSLPEDVQEALYRTIEGLERVEIMRPAYAIEYDCADPLCLAPTLESLEIRGLFGAGQFNGTSGYEEAAAQGLVAGINAARQAQGREPVVFERQQSYIGTLIDDIVTKGTLDPYRMMTSRSEYRLYLRQDNADERLTPLGRELGLVDDDRFALFCKRLEEKENEIKRLKTTRVLPQSARALLEEKGMATLHTAVSALELLKRPQLGYKDVACLAGAPPNAEEPDDFVCEKIETEVKYAGYIAKQEQRVKAARKMESMQIPVDFSYQALTGVSMEAREKLAMVRPLSLGQASRISGVSPSDISALVLALKLARANAKKEAAPHAE